MKRRIGKNCFLNRKTKDLSLDNKTDTSLLVSLFTSFANNPYLLTISALICAYAAIHPLVANYIVNHSLEVTITPKISEKENTFNFFLFYQNSGNRAEVISNMNLGIKPRQNSKMIFSAPLATGSVELLKTSNSPAGVRIPKGTGLVCTATETYYFIPQKDFEIFNISPNETLIKEIQFPLSNYNEILSYFASDTVFQISLDFEVIDSNGFWHKSSFSIYEFNNNDRNNIRFINALPSKFNIIISPPSQGTFEAQKLQVGGLPIGIVNPLYKEKFKEFVVFNE